MPERNAPCPCGSSKKFKRCCGQAAVQPLAPDYFKINQAIAYKGELGQLRQAFCEEYASTKKEVIAEIEIKLSQEATERGKPITCHKGCGHCCDVYIFANLQEAETIVHYLYKHEPVLQYFLQQYPRWKERINTLGATLSRIDQTQEKVLFGVASEEDQREFDNDLSAYTALHNTCPFLKDEACIIYEVRPYACAGVVSINPPEYCAPGHPARAQNSLLKADFQPQNDLPYFLTTTAAINFGCMPALVHQILFYGYSFLSSIAGLEEMQPMALKDPEVITVLARFSQKK